MSGGERVAQRVCRRRYARIGGRGGRGTYIEIERSSVPALPNEGISCLARAFLGLAPAAIDIALWYATAHGHAEAVGPAFVGVPIALIMAFLAAQAS